MSICETVSAITMKSNNSFEGHGNRPTIATCLDSNKEHQIVRIVNATESKVVFTVDSETGDKSTNVEINPMRGVLKPGGFTYLRIRNTKYLKVVEEPTVVELRYKRLGLNEYEPAQVYGRIKLKMKTGSSSNYLHTGYRNFYYLLFRIFRATLLLVLIIYNIILIKYEIFR